MTSNTDKEETPEETFKRVFMRKDDKGNFPIDSHFSLCKAYHQERLKIEQVKPITTSEKDIEDKIKLLILHWDCDYETTKDGIRAQNDIEEYCTEIARWMRDKYEKR